MSTRTTPTGSLPTLAGSVEQAIGVIRSNQDTLLHKVKRSEAVMLQLEVNAAAIAALKDALKEVGVHVN